MTNEQQPGGIIPAAERTNEELMMALVDIAEDPRVAIRAAFIPDPEVDVLEDNPPLTHQVMVLTVGDLVSMSQPVPMNRPFRATFVDEDLFIPAGSLMQ